MAIRAAGTKPREAVPSRLLPSRTRHQTDLSGSQPPLLPSPCPPAQALWVSCRPKAPAWGRRRRGGISWQGHGPRHSLLDALGQRADRQAPDAISGGAPLRAQFPFFHRPSETGLGGRVYTSRAPSSRPGWGWGQVRDGCQTVTIWSFTNRGGLVSVTSPTDRCLGTFYAMGLAHKSFASVRCSFPTTW